CAYLKSSKGVQLANLVTTQEMDGPIRTAHAQTIKYLKNLGFDGKQALLLEYYTKEADDLVALSKKKVTLTHP
ncbi:MAG: hypothetical protein AAF711_05920, partial [Planctomycetota bacterium]